jgi:hypothetical protein
MPDEVLHHLADKFTSEVLPYIKALRLDRYLTSPAFFDDVARIMKQEGTVLLFREGFKPSVLKETIH